MLFLAARCSETVTVVYQVARHHVIEDRDLHSHLRSNLKSHKNYVNIDSKTKSATEP
jgi:hypothetical protein